MDHCLAFSREPSGQGEINPDFQAQGILHPPQATRSRAGVALTHEVTILLVGLNVLVYLAMVASGASPTNPTSGQLLFWGGTQGLRVLLHNEYWRLLTSNYVHIGILHLGVNMWCLWGLGRLAELFYSRRDYLLLYTFTGIAGSALSVGLHPYIISAGASGAIFGIAGVLLTTLKYGNLPLPEANRKTLFKSILQFAGINLVLGFALAGVDNAGHLGGLLSGLLIGGVLGKHLDGSEASTDHRRRAWLLLALGLMCFVWLVVRFWVRG